MRPEVLQRCSAAAGPDGDLRFDRFVDIALYDPNIGYYTSTRPPFGPGGDFYTAPHVDPLFGRTVGRRVLAEYESLGRPTRFSVVEVGPGDGRLAVSVAREIAAAVSPPPRIEFVLVDRSRELATRAVTRWDEANLPDALSLRVAGSLGQDGPFVGVVLANELLDAMPFRRLVWRRGNWRELGVSVGTDRLRWAESSEPAEFPGPALSPGPQEGAVTEISPAAEGFPREVADHLLRGVALVLDFGYAEDEYVRGHPLGTAAAIRSHRVQPDLLEGAGEVDVSAFVNFTRVRGAAKRAGLKEVGFRRQAEALGAWGLPQVLEEEKRRAASAEESVRVLMQGKNLAFGFENFCALELSP